MRANDYPLAETPDLLLAALELANDAVVVIDDDLRVSHLNAAAERIWGLDRAEMQGCHASDLGLKNLNGSENSSEITIHRKDGGRILAALSLSRIEVGGQSRIIAFVRDITSEIDRRERLALLNLVADETNRAVIVTDPDLRTVYTNAAFTKVFGYSLEEATGRKAAELLAGRCTDRKTLARLRRGIRTEGGGDEEILAYDKNGDEVWLSASVKAFRNRRGRVK